MVITILIIIIITIIMVVEAFIIINYFTKLIFFLSFKLSGSYLNCQTTYPVINFTVFSLHSILDHF